MANYLASCFDHNLEKEILETPILESRAKWQKINILAPKCRVKIYIFARWGCIARRGEIT